MIRFLFFIAQIVVIAGVALNARAEPLRLTITPDPVVDPVQLNCLAKNIYFEARNQSSLAMVAVAQVTLNRVESDKFPDTICKVIKQGPLDGSEISKHRCQFSWFCDGKPDVAPVNDTFPEVVAWDTALLVAELVYWNELPDPTNGSTYYHADYVEPAWRTEFEYQATIDDHIFYTY